MQNEKKEIAENKTTCVMPFRFILNRLRSQFPVERLLSRPNVMLSLTINCIKTTMTKQMSFFKIRKSDSKQIKTKFYVLRLSKHSESYEDLRKTR